MLAEVFAPLPDSLYISDEKTFNELEFSSERVVQYRHEGVGSGKFYQWTLRGIYLLKVNNRNTRARCEICSKLTIKTFVQIQEYKY